MANYKIVDADQLDADLTRVANAIRAKGGYSDAMAFPDEFVQEISAIETGGTAAADPVLEAITATENGVYVPGEGVDGFSSVTVCVASEGAKPFDCHSVTFMCGDTVLYVRSVVTGYTCDDPISLGFIETPTMESTAQYHYTFSGWSTTDGGNASGAILQNITGDKTVYAAFSATVRSYTITWLDDDGETVLATTSAKYGAVPSYTATKTGYVFQSWTPTPVAVTGEASYTSSWVAATAGGTCGTNARWILNAGVLTIYGTGATTDFKGSDDAQPWKECGDQIASIIIEEGITHIGDFSFYNIYGDYGEGLTSITIPDSVTTIGQYAFAYHPSLVEINFGTGLLELGDAAFYENRALPSVSLPEGVTTVGSKCFAFCTSLTEFTFPESVVTIGNTALFYCLALTHVVFGSNVTCFGWRMFYYDAALTSVTFKNPVGWYVTETKGATSGTNLTLTNPTANVTYCNSTYTDYYWYRSV